MSGDSERAFMMSNPTREQIEARRRWQLAGGPALTEDRNKQSLKDEAIGLRRALIAAALTAGGTLALGELDWHAAPNYEMEVVDVPARRERHVIVRRKP